MLAPQKQSPAIYVHHLAGYIAGLISMTCRKGTYFSTAIMFTELSLLPVSVMSVMDRLGVSKVRPLYKNTFLIRVIMWLVTRTFAVPFIIVRGLEFTSRMIKLQRASGESPIGNRAASGEPSIRECLATLKARLPTAVSGGVVCDYSLFMVLNVVWTIQLLQKFLKQNKKVVRIVT
eukprot:TRINITY_DN19565_c0_g1_i1.p1 TRINITY_DN19565_c0_g1~~TRINITY_DN19565_c0_g1_i1.p1  ORF type:complete len:176 (-),score=43.89 TRINITY_DN19565_c0_g1_i1:4-531(-)